MQRFLANIFVYLLKNKKLTGNNKTKVITALLKNIDALPIMDIVTFDAQGTLLINGVKLDTIQTIQLLDSVRALKDSYAEKLFTAQITYEAIKIGTYNGLTPEMIQFSKAALWVIQEKNKLINAIIQE